MTRSFQITLSDVQRCPRRSLSPGHYNDDGSCRCEDEVRRAARQVGPILIEPLRRRATGNGHDLALTPLEFQLLAKLVEDPHRVYTKAELMRDVWGAEGITRSTRTLDTHAYQLRRKLKEATDARFVVNVWGVGYRLMP